MGGEARVALNTRDKSGLVHAVRRPPSDLILGHTACGFFFTWPIYSQTDRASRWVGTHDAPTCLACIVCPENNP